MLFRAGILPSQVFCCSRAALTPEGRSLELVLPPGGSFPQPRVLCHCPCSVSGLMWCCSKQVSASPSSNCVVGNSKANPSRLLQVRSSACLVPSSSTCKKCRCLAIDVPAHAQAHPHPSQLHGQGEMQLAHRPRHTHVANPRQNTGMQPPINISLFPAVLRFLLHTNCTQPPINKHTETAPASMAAPLSLLV